MSDTQKYEVLKRELYIIREKIDLALNTYNDLKSTIKFGIIIDNKVPNEESLNNINKKINNIRNEITNIVIPSVNNKL